MRVDQPGVRAGPVEVARGSGCPGCVARGRDGSALASRVLGVVQRRQGGHDAVHRITEPAGRPGTSWSRCGKATNVDHQAGEQQDDEHDERDDEHGGLSSEKWVWGHVPTTSRSHTHQAGPATPEPLTRGVGEIDSSVTRSSGVTAARITSGIGVTGRAGSVLSTYTCTKRPSAAASSRVALEEPDPVDRRRGADLVDDQAHLDRRREADLAEVAARGLGDHADLRQQPDVEPGRLVEVGVDGGVEQLVVGRVVQVAVGVVVAPPGRDRAPGDVVGAGRPRGPSLLRPVTPARTRAAAG